MSVTSGQALLANTIAAVDGGKAANSNMLTTWIAVALLANEAVRLRKAGRAADSMAANSNEYMLWTAAELLADEVVRLREAAGVNDALLTLAVEKEMYVAEAVNA